MFLRLTTAAVVVLLLAFLLTLVEAAVIRTSRARVEELADDGRAGARSLAAIVADAPRHLAVLSFLRALGETTAAVLLTLAVRERVEGLVPSLAIAIAAMSVISFVVVGVSPRTLGRAHSDRVALLSAPVLRGLTRVLGPLARLLIAFGNAVTPGRGDKDGPFRSEAELRDLVDIANESSLIEATERAMIHSVFELGDTITREVMVPRTDMITIEATKSCRQAMSLFLRSGFSRVPVIGEDTDDIVGLLYLKDVARRVNGDDAARELPVTVAMRPAPFVPESKPVDDLMRDMQIARTHLAIVVDEYGGTAGLVTIEDILEEIVGEIADEYDRETPDVEDLGGGRYRVQASMDIDDLAERFGVDIEEDDVDTVGGLIGKTIGRVPILGSHCVVGGLSMTAERMSGRRHRIATVVVERVGTSADETEGGAA